MVWTTSGSTSSTLSCKVDAGCPILCIAGQGTGKLLAHPQLGRDYACCLNGCGLCPGPLCTAMSYAV